MMKSKLNLIILILDDDKFEYNILSLSEDKIIPPYLEIKEYLDIDQSIKHILSSYIKNNEILYSNYKLIDLEIDNEINVYYYCFITFNTSVHNSYKIPITKYDKNLPNLQKILKSL